MLETVPCWVVKKGKTMLSRRFSRLATPFHSNLSCKTNPSKLGIYAHFTTQVPRRPHSSWINTSLVLGVTVISTFAAYHYLTKSSPNESVGLTANEYIRKRLSEREQSHVFPYHPLIPRIDVSQLASNNPCEDRYAIYPLTDGHGWIMVVCDGHAGTECAELVHKELPKRVVQGLAELPVDASHPIKNAQDVERVLIQAFESLDNDIIHQRAKEALALVDKNTPLVYGSIDDGVIEKGRILLEPAVAGCCTVLAYLDTISDRLTVACTGDSRVVLGQIPTLDDSGSSNNTNDMIWEVVRVTQDQTLRNPLERARFIAEHPNESPDTLTARNRILGGLEPTRAFGDARYKWTREISDRIHATFFPDKRGTPAASLTPPYVTARPEVTHIEGVSDRVKCIVMATDGLWDGMRDDQVIQILHEHARIHKQDIHSSAANENTSLVSAIKNQLSSTSLVAKSSIWAHEDGNAATCLIRNELGGRNKEKIQRLLKLEAPISRRYRDDITVLVMWLDNRREGMARAWQDDVKKQWQTGVNVVGKVKGGLKPALQKDDDA